MRIRGVLPISMPVQPTSSHVLMEAGSNRLRLTQLIRRLMTFSGGVSQSLGTGIPPQLERIERIRGVMTMSMPVQPTSSHVTRMEAGPNRLRLTRMTRLVLTFSGGVSQSLRMGIPPQLERVMILRGVFLPLPVQPTSSHVLMEAGPNRLRLTQVIRRLVTISGGVSQSLGTGIPPQLERILRIQGVMTMSMPVQPMCSLFHSFPEITEWQLLTRNVTFVKDG